MSSKQYNDTGDALVDLKYISAELSEIYGACSITGTHPKDSPCFKKSYELLIKITEDLRQYMERK